MIRCETAMIRRMPILSGDHKIKTRLQLIYQGNDLIALRNSECAPGHEIVLDIDKD